MRKLKTNLEQQSVQSNVLSHRVRSRQSLRVNCPPGGGGGAFPRRLMVCAAGWGRIFTTELTIMRLHFSVLKELLKWGRKVSFRYR